MDEMDNIIRKQIELEKILEKTTNPSKKLYLMQMKVWINNYIGGMMSYPVVSNLLDRRIKEFKN